MIYVLAKIVRVHVSWLYRQTCNSHNLVSTHFLICNKIQMQSQMLLHSFIQRNVHVLMLQYACDCGFQWCIAIKAGRIVLTIYNGAKYYGDLFDVNLNL